MKLQLGKCYREQEFEHLHDMSRNIYYDPQEGLFYFIDYQAKYEEGQNMSVVGRITAVSERLTVFHVR